MLTVTVNRDALKKLTSLNVSRLKRNIIDGVAMTLRKLAIEMYEDKSHGSSGEDGATWSPITDETKRRRVRNTEAFRSKSNEIQALRLSLKILRSRSADDRAPRQRILRAGVRNQQDIRDRIAAANEERASIRSPNDGLIGVDTGAQQIAVGSTERQQDAAYRVLPTEDGAEITVGTLIDYSVYFDGARPILPGEAPDAWIREVETTVAGEMGKTGVFS